MSTILTAAVTGNLTMPDQNPALPVTPAQIAASALEAASEGAAVVHLHVRDPKTARGSMRLDLYEEVVARIRDRDRDVILNLTTGEGGRFVPARGDPRRADAGSTLTGPAARVAHVEALRPEICTLDFNTMWSGQAAVINAPWALEEMARRITAFGTLPEAELFDQGDIRLMVDFQARGLIPRPALAQIVLGVRWGAPADPRTLAHMVSLLPPGTVWAALGVGRMAFPMLAQALLLGGHVRIGMEDTVHLSKGTLTPGNGALVAKARRIVEDLGSALASPAQARDLLGLSAAAPATA
ncbi:MAG: 3-keto-5-aminohexanoate cleavage protein [Pseudomonadota bacterium]